jgi:hypothetical protein
LSVSRQVKVHMRYRKSLLKVVFAFQGATIMFSRSCEGD